jgi:FlaA1/EpsC-like NDP-sugar epimerase
MGSNGSVIPFFMKMANTGVLPITDEKMTRFNITLNDGVNMVMHALETAWGGELFVPKIPSYRITDVAEAVAPNCKIDIIGVRPGEKIHEEMITSSDSFSTYDLGKYYVILPQVTKWNLDNYISMHNAVKVENGFQYNSGENEDWLSVEEIRELISKNVEFK